MEFKTAKYRLRKNVKDAKKHYKEKLDSFYSTADAGLMWHGLQHITEYKGTTTGINNSTITLPEQLNQFFAWREQFVVALAASHQNPFNNL